MNIFEQASRTKLRFKTPKGMLSAEDLWDLPLSSGAVHLKALAESIKFELDKQPVAALDFFKSANTKDTTMELRFEIVKHIVISKVEEAEAKTEAAAKESQREHIKSLIAKKKQASLEELSIEELEKLAAQ